MQKIDALLPKDDGLKWFNFLYLKVTEEVLRNPPAGGWSSLVWLAPSSKNLSESSSK
jgi:hypothetical protein